MQEAVKGEGARRRFMLCLVDWPPKSERLGQRACFAAFDCVESRFFLPRNQTGLTETECPDASLPKLRV
jgi:hypothetical protein